MGRVVYKEKRGLGSEDYTALLTACWNWLLQGDTLGTFPTLRCHPEEPGARRRRADDEGSRLYPSWAGYEHRRRDPSSLALLGMTVEAVHPDRR